MGSDQDKQQLELPQFFPYRLSILQANVSDAIAQLYSGRFKLSRQEWRVLAALGTPPDMSAKEIASYTSMEKMPVSRAISRLVRDGLISQRPSQSDRRKIILNLTDQGRSVYEEIVPLVLEREATLLSVLSEDEQQQLEALMSKLLSKAKEINEN